MADEISNTDIAELAISPEMTRTAEGIVQERSVDELIKGQRFIQQQNTPETVPWGVRMAKRQAGSPVS